VPLSPEQDGLLQGLLSKYWLIASDTIGLDSPVPVVMDDGTTIHADLDEQSVELGYRMGFLNALQVLGAGMEPVEVMQAAARAALALEDYQEGGEG
jgi:hypothetical protein